LRFCWFISTQIASVNSSNNYDPAAAEKLLDAAGLPRVSRGVPSANGQRFHLTIKVSAEEQARLIGAALQDQWKKIGVDLEVRSLELATLFADLTKGNFQLSYLKWVGANNDPDVFALVFSSKRIPPNGSNGGRYRNPKVRFLRWVRGPSDWEGGGRWRGGLRHGRDI
jgi:ABC-type transport system substrate-binding protein